ncbi:MAG TPA: DUF1615 domain-containing protein [Nevskiaceae bacterium]|nr:DUF1615 domain-containing protein [Nevskiaceae bacterium]
MRATILAALLLALSGCATGPSVEGPRLTPDEARALIAKLLPAQAADRAGWAADIYVAFTAMEIAPSPVNVCSVIAVTEQESSFQVEPLVPGLGVIAWREIYGRAERFGVPRKLVRAALGVPSPDGRSYAERIDAARNERELSEIFEDLIGIVPGGQALFAGSNPVRTGGPMQVSIAFAQDYADDHPYPYPVERSIRREVFTRRGGMYFGIAHLLDYPADYERPLFRFADFNAGHYASRNAGFQNALAIATGVPLALDGDLIRARSSAADPPGATETAARVLGKRLDLDADEIRDDLEKGGDASFGKSRLYARVFDLADERQGRAVPRAVVPKIKLQSPKISRDLTTEWFANRVETRYQRCLARSEP